MILEGFVFKFNFAYQSVEMHIVSECPREQPGNSYIFNICQMILCGNLALKKTVMQTSYANIQ